MEIVKENESGEDQLFCCNSIGPLTDKEAIFNQFMEKRGTVKDRIFEVKKLTKDRSNNGYWLSTNYYVLQDGIRTKIPKPDIIQHSEITVLNTACELNYLWFEMNLYEIPKSIN